MEPTGLRRCDGSSIRPNETEAPDIVNVFRVSSDIPKIIDSHQTFRKSLIIKLKVAERSASSASPTPSSYVLVEWISFLSDVIAIDLKKTYNHLLPPTARNVDGYAMPMIRKKYSAIKWRAQNQRRAKDILSGPSHRLNQSSRRAGDHCELSNGGKPLCIQKS